MLKLTTESDIVVAHRLKAWGSYFTWQTRPNKLESKTLDIKELKEGKLAFDLELEWRFCALSASNSKAIFRASWSFIA